MTSDFCFICGHARAGHDEYHRKGDGSVDHPFTPAPQGGTGKPGPGLEARDGAIRVGDYVRLKAGGGPMGVIAVRKACDGTGGDGAGLYCEWWTEDVCSHGWVSESAVEKCDGPED